MLRHRHIGCHDLVASCRLHNGWISLKLFFFCFIFFHYLRAMLTMTATTLNLYDKFKSKPSQISSVLICISISNIYCSFDGQMCQHQLVLVHKSARKTKYILRKEERKNEFIDLHLAMFLFVSCLLLDIQRIKFHTWFACLLK